MLHPPHRPHHPRHRAAALALALSALTLVLLPAAALAATTFPSPKAAIEHAERQAAEATQPSQPNKAQIEHHELPVPSSHDPQPESGSTGDAALWQLVMSAVLGAVLTGAVVVTSRRVGQHRHVATS